MGIFSPRYQKPGKGVAKDAPKKKPFFEFFEIYARKFWKLCTANLLFVLIGLPILSRGLADAGLTYITRNFAREKHAFVGDDFLETIKKNWKQALPIGIINTLLTALIVYVFLMYWGGVGGQSFSWLGSGLTILAYILFTVMKYYIPILTITFDFKLKQIYRNAALFVFIGWKANLLISAVLLLCYAILFLLPYFGGVSGMTIDILLILAVFPAFRSFLIQYAIFPTIKRVIIDPYYEQHPDADKDKRRDLNLDVGEDEEAEDDRVFTDMGVTPVGEAESKPQSTIPRQYTADEMRHLENKRLHIDDDDDTI